MLGFVGISEIPAPARVEFRAYYGGLELGFALFLTYCARSSAFRRPGLLAATSIFAGCAFVRGIGIIVSGQWCWPLLASFAGEATLALATGLLFRRTVPRSV